MKPEEIARQVENELDYSPGSGFNDVEAVSKAVDRNRAVIAKAIAADRERHSNIRNLAAAGDPVVPLFVMPGTDLEVSIARMTSTPELTVHDPSFMVYIRRKTDIYNTGFVRIDTETLRVSWSCEGLSWPEGTRKDQLLRAVERKRAADAAYEPLAKLALDVAFALHKNERCQPTGIASISDTEVRYWMKGWGSQEDEVWEESYPVEQLLDLMRLKETPPNPTPESGKAPPSSST